MKYKAVIIDFDGTAVDSPQKTVGSKRLAKAVSELESLGVKVCAATGRPETMAMEVIKSIDLQQPSIISGGAQIFDADRKTIVNQILLEPAQLREIIDILRTEEYRCLWNDNPLNDYIDRGGWSVEKFDDFESTFFFQVCYIPIADVDTLIEKLADIKEINISKATAHRPQMVDLHITHIKATKEHAIEDLAKMIGVSQALMIGVGDGANDIHLFNAVGHKVAMGNAVAELKNQADEIIGDIKDDGLAEYFERLIEEIENDRDKSLNLKDIEIVQPAAGDALALAKMHAQSWRDSYVGINGSTIEWVEERMKNRASEKGLRIYRETFEKARTNPEECYYRIAKSGDEVVGFLHGINEGKQEVGAVYIAKQYKGTGLAQKMMGGLMSWFDLSRDIEFAVVRDNTRAVNFYKSYGFEIIDSDPKDYERYLPLIVVKMKRRGDKK